MKKEIQHSRLESDLEVKEELESILSSEDDYNENTISIYDVLKTIENANEKLSLLKNNYATYFKKMLKKEFKNPVIEIKQTDYRQKKLVLLFSPDYRSYECKSIILAERKFGLYIEEDNTGYGMQVLKILENHIPECYAELLKYSEFLYAEEKIIKSLNSKLFVFISKFGVSLSNYEGYTFHEHFYFRANSGFGAYDKNSYDYRNLLSMSYIVINGNEENLLKRIFVQIEDCPEWCRDILYKKREKQLDNNYYGPIKTKILTFRKKWSHQK